MVVVAVSDVGVAAVSVAYDAIVIDSNHEGKLVAPVEPVGYLIGLADAFAVAVIRRHRVFSVVVVIGVTAMVLVQSCNFSFWR